MWNFSGRESDFSNAPYLSIWNTITTEFPNYIKENKGHNNYFMLPLILGLIGMFFQAKHDPDNGDNGRLRKESKAMETREDNRDNDNERQQ